MGQTMRRGKPVNFWRSCQIDTNIKANFYLDLYFTRKIFNYYNRNFFSKLSLCFLKARDYNSSVIWDETIKEVPVAAEVYGYTDINDASNTFKNFSRVYSFFDFRSYIEDKERAFRVNLIL
jgi:hypothetical protein